MKPKLKNYGERVYLDNGRTGMIVGHTIVKRISHAESPEPYYIVDLDNADCGYLDSSGESAKDMFISMVLVHVGNIGKEVSA